MESTPAFTLVPTTSVHRPLRDQQNHLRFVMNPPSAPMPSRVVAVGAVPLSEWASAMNTPPPSSARGPAGGPLPPRVSRRRELVHQHERDRLAEINDSSMQSTRGIHAIPSTMFRSQETNLVSAYGRSKGRGAKTASAAVVAPSSSSRIDAFTALDDCDAYAPPVRDLLLWERLRRLSDATASDMFDGSVGVLHDLLGAFEALLEHGLGCSPQSIHSDGQQAIQQRRKDAKCNAGPSPATSLPGDMDASPVQMLGILLYRVCKAGLCLNKDLDRTAVSCCAHKVLSDPSIETTFGGCDDSDNPPLAQWYDGIRGMDDDMPRKHPMLQSFKASLVETIADATATRHKVEELEAKTHALSSVVQKYALAYDTITHGGVPLRAADRSSRAHGGATDAVSDSGSASPVSPATTTTPGNGASRQQRAVVSPPMLEREPSDIQPHGSASACSTAARDLKPVALGAAEAVIDDLLAQNRALLTRVATLSADRATHLSRIVYLERQVEELNQAASVIVRSNVELSQQYKASLNGGSGAGVGSGGGGGSTASLFGDDGNESRSIVPRHHTSRGRDVQLYSPMLLDGRSAEMVAHQSTMGIMALLGHGGGHVHHAATVVTSAAAPVGNRRPSYTTSPTGSDPLLLGLTAPRGSITIGATQSDMLEPSAPQRRRSAAHFSPQPTNPS